MKKTRSKTSRDSIPLNCYFGTTFGISQSKIYLLYLGNTNIRSKPMRIWLRNTSFFLANLRICNLRTRTPRPCGFAIYRFAICRLAHLINLRICGCGISPRICRFAICGLTKKFASTPLQLRHVSHKLIVFNIFL